MAGKPKFKEAGAEPEHTRWVGDGIDGLYSDKHDQQDKNHTY